MQTVSALYRRLLSDPQHVREMKASIAGVEYGQDNLISCAVSAGLFSELAVGQCVAKELDLIVIPTGTIPRMARIDLYVRLVLGNEVSEWLPKGAYYVDTRSVDEASGFLSLHGYDSMLKAEQTYLAEGDPGEWPRSQRAVINEIAARMGVPLDSRTVINAAYQMEYPNDYTMRELLGFVAAAHGSNWIMTDENKLLLLPLGVLPAETSFLTEDSGAAILMGDVRLIV